MRTQSELLDGGVGDHLEAGGQRSLAGGQHEDDERRVETADVLQCQRVDGDGRDEQRQVADAPAQVQEPAEELGRGEEGRGLRVAADVALADAVVHRQEDAPQEHVRIDQVAVHHLQVSRHLHKPGHFKLKTDHFLTLTNGLSLTSYLDNEIMREGNHYCTRHPNAVSYQACLQRNARAKTTIDDLGADLLFRVEEEVELAAGLHVEANHLAEQVETALGHFARRSGGGGGGTGAGRAEVGAAAGAAVGRQFGFEQDGDDVLQQAPVDDEQLVGHAKVAAAAQPALHGAAQPESASENIQNQITTVSLRRLSQQWHLWHPS